LVIGQPIYDEQKYLFFCQPNEYYKVITAVRKCIGSNLFNKYMPERVVEDIPSAQDIPVSNARFKCSFFYNMLIQDKVVEFQYQKWELTNETSPEKIWSLSHNLPLDNKVKQLQYKLLHRIVPCNKYLHQRLKIKPDSLCEVCNAEDSIEHYFLECPQNIGFWSDVRNFLFALTNKNVSDTEIMLGVFDNRKYQVMVNHFLLHAKYFVYSCQVADKGPHYQAFITVLKSNVKTLVKVYPDKKVSKMYSSAFLH